MTKVIYLMNGPNLNLLGRRDQAIYGKETLEDVINLVKSKAEGLGYEVIPLQSNHEGQLIDWIQQSPGRVDGIILNAGGLTHTSISLRNAVDFARGQGVPTVEVHLSDIHKREPFRHTSFLTEKCIGQVSGLGVNSYIKGLTDLIQFIGKEGG